MCGPFKNEGKQIMILKILSSIDASKSIWYWIKYQKLYKDREDTEETIINRIFL